MATQPRPQDPAPAEPAQAWEASLERIERELAQLKVIEVDTSWELQLVIARQLRELILAIRPLTKHPWYPRRS